MIFNKEEFPDYYIENNNKTIEQFSETNDSIIENISDKLSLEDEKNLKKMYYSKTEINEKFKELNKKITDLTEENTNLKKKVEILGKQTNRLQYEKADYFYLKNN